MSLNETIASTRLDVGGLVACPDAVENPYRMERHVGIATPAALEAVVGRALRPHKLSFDDKGELDAEIFMMRGTGVSLVCHKYGKTVDIAPSGEGRFIVVDMPLVGDARYWFDGEDIYGSAGQAAIVPGDRPVRVRFERNLQQVIVRLEWERITQACSRYFGVDGISGLRFEPRLDLSGPIGRAWKHGVYGLLEFGQTIMAFSHRAAYATQLEDSLIVTLLAGQSNSLTRECVAAARTRPAVMAGYVKRAVDYMHANYDQAITISEVANAVGVSHNALASRFRETFQQSPLEYLRDLRLKRVREELQGGSQDRSLTEIALRHGFSHYGHFSAYYLNRFGEYPRETQQRGRSA